MADIGVDGGISIRNVPKLVDRNEHTLVCFGSVPQVDDEPDIAFIFRFALVTEYQQANGANDEFCTLWYNH